jgi:hypothetical protein
LGGKLTVLRSYKNLGIDPYTKDYGGVSRPLEGLRKNTTEFHHFLRKRKGQESPEITLKEKKKKKKKLNSKMYNRRYRASLSL